MASDKWAVLIGIDYYHHPDGPDHKDSTPQYDISGQNIGYPSLDGCVNDILEIEKYLLTTICVPSDHITKLLAPVPGSKHHAKTHGNKILHPTYLNIVKALEDIHRYANKGDFVYIHYSGHGARSTTIFTGLKDVGREDLDECLVPCDITNGGQYLRDLEMGALLQDLADKELILTVVLDCCHSGGAVRGDQVMPAGKVRTIPSIHKSEPSCEKPKNLDKVMALGRKDSWLKSPKGFVLLAACRERQFARECEDGPNTYGVLTYYLLRCLQYSNVDISSEYIFNNVLSAVHNHYSDQTPHFLGDLDRFFFSRENRSRMYALSVRKVIIDQRKESNDWCVVLNGHSLNGVQIGSEYDILPFGFDLSPKIGGYKILGRVKVARTDSSGSIATFIPGIEILGEEIHEGCLAVLHELPLDQHTTVHFDAPNKQAKIDFAELWHDHQGDATWLQLVDGKKPGDFIVSVTNGDIFEINPGHDILSATMKHCLGPLMAKHMKASLPRLIKRLQHAARFKMTKELGSNRVSQPRLADIQIVPAEGSVSNIEKDGIYWQVAHGDRYRITVSNCSPFTLALTILNCDPELRVARIFPREEKYCVLDADSPLFSETFESCYPTEPSGLYNAAQAGLPILEVIKVFVSKFGDFSHPQDLDTLQLMSLQEFENPSRRGIGAETAGSDNLAAVLNGLDTRRRAKHVPSENEEMSTWQVVDFPLRVIPPGP
ncbi:caspase domain-containing protein [Hypomontagnella monticulosa]|nr:caspase domain-containing protein [Hypomontagnella monticulosa]